MDAVPSPVACCIGGSDDDALALAEAARLARSLGHPLCTVHATSDHERLGRAQLDGADAPGVVVLDAVVIADEGDAPAAVCAWAETEGAEALVVAPRRGPLARLLLGSFASHLAQRAPCDVLIARPTEHAAGPGAPPGRPVSALVEPVETLGPDETLRDALGPLGTSGCPLPVVGASGELVGLLGYSEVLTAVAPPAPVRVSGSRVPAGDEPQLRHRAARALDDRVGDHMREPASAHPDDATLEAARLMSREGIDALPVVRSWARVDGIVRAGALLSSLGREDTPRAEGDGRTGRFAHIACCVDDSVASRVALARAAALREPDGVLTVVHSIDQPGREAEAAQRLLADAAQEAGAESALLQGEPGVAVERWAAEAGADLLVAAAHRGPMARLALGSFAGHLAQNAPCPVLLVRRLDGAGRIA